MIFAIIGEELGLVGGTLVIAAYAAFAWAGLRIALRCRDPFGKVLAAGLTALVCGQAALNLAAVVGVAPLTGIPLPLVSYGGTSLVVMLASVGILLNIARSDGVEVTAAVRDRGRGDGRSRDAVARRRARRSAPAACSVSFAGSPDRIEARLVPEAGFEFDPFRISGLPRRPGVAQLRAVLLAGRAPRACARILAARRPRRRPGRRRVRGGPDGLRRLAEADPCRADRGGRAPRAGEPARRAVRAAGLPRVSGRGQRAEVPGRRPAGRCAAAPVPAREARARFGLPAGRAGAARLRRQPGRGRAERDRDRRVRRRKGRRCSTSAASGTSRRSRAASRGRTTGCCRGPTISARRSTPATSCSRAPGGSVWEVAAAGQAGGARPVAERDGRPPDEERALLRGGGRRGRRARGGDRARPGGRARAARRRRAARRDGRGDARGREAGGGRRDRRGADRPCSLER